MAGKEGFDLEARYTSLARRVSGRDPELSFEEYSDFVFLAVYRLCTVKYSPQYMGSILMAIAVLTRRWKGRPVAPSFIENADRLVASLEDAGKNAQAFDALDLFVDFAFDTGDMETTERFLQRAFDVYDRLLSPDERWARDHSHSSMEIDHQHIENGKRYGKAAETEPAKGSDTVATQLDAMRDLIELDGLVD
jgi:hypothetical protein